MLSQGLVHTKSAMRMLRLVARCMRFKVHSLLDLLVQKCTTTDTEVYALVGACVACWRDWHGKDHCVPGGHILYLRAR